MRAGREKNEEKIKREGVKGMVEREREKGKGEEERRELGLRIIAVIMSGVPVPHRPKAASILTL